MDKIVDFPLALWTPTGISKVASYIGIPLSVDALTTKRTRLTFARVCVQISKDSPLPDSIPLEIDGEDMILKVVYDWKPTSCEGCRSLIHPFSLCSKNPNPSSALVLPPRPHGRSTSRPPRPNTRNPSKTPPISVATENPLLPSPMSIVEPPVSSVVIPIPPAAPPKPPVLQEVKAVAPSTLNLIHSDPHLPLLLPPGNANLIPNLNSPNAEDHSEASSSTSSPLEVHHHTSSSLPSSSNLPTSNKFKALIVEDSPIIDVPNLQTLSFFCLLEAKVHSSSVDDDWFIHSHRIFDNEMHCHNFGFSILGRIWIKWDPTHISFSPYFISSQLIHGIISVGSLPPFQLSIIYAANTFEEQTSLWTKIRELTPSSPLPWMVMGDLNCYRFPNEKAGGTPASASKLSELKGLVFDCGLHDLASVGLLYTWHNQRSNHPIHIKLDRVLVNSDFLNHFPQAHYKITAPVCSDHAPLFTSITSPNGLPCRFLFKNYWTFMNGFWDDVLTAFSEPFLKGPICHLQHCIKVLKGLLKNRSWTSSNFLSNSILELKCNLQICLDNIQI
ncbi:uncharacterized protein LOC110111903 [Dendrobium catenatum]|uniref:uncharacterized protein LOC110111903 n=1 Tax=Dendrobium catenatum TaxID=906689 RepID=UPI0009F254BB|nr:uncharacterized protein LOC110111903 [Dendrobium catenatum]